MEAAASRTCKKCNLSKPATSEFFYTRGSSFIKSCITCERKRALDCYHTKKITHMEHLNRKRRESRYKLQYGIPLEELEKLYIEANNKCQICSKTVIGKDRHLDHNHSTGKIRGLLCSQHNLMLGNANDSIDILQKAIKYLREAL